MKRKLSNNESNNDKEYSLSSELKRAEITNAVRSLIGSPMKSVLCKDKL